jgi:hypothetical protein
MALRKRSSTTLDNAEQRANSLETINPALDLGTGLSLVKFKQLIADGRAKLNAYNQTLTLADHQGNDVDAAEKVARDYSGRMLAGIAAMHGKDSNEYEAAGGTRESERKRPTSKKKKTP